MRNFDRGNRSNSRRGGDRNSGPREMHRAICDECGDSCEVPFKPTGNKPIFCSHCFEKQGGSDSRHDDRRDSRRGGRDSFRSNSREREMFSTVCDECGDVCEVPFKPSNDKPIFCSTCFSKKDGQARFDKGNNKGGGKNNQFEAELKVINDKLDQILQSISSAPAKKVITVAKKKAVVKLKIVKKKVVAKKKTAKKKVKKVTKKAKKKKVTKKKK
jgi:CxxC-x17-CxxC domain-containing protein